MNLAAYMHRMDPFALGPFTIGPFEGIGIRWYGLAYVAGFVVGYWLIRTLSKRNRTLIAPDRVGDWVLAVVIGTVAGGRLGYCIFYKPDLLIDFSTAPPFWGALAINDGGMSSHGGMIGIWLACLWFSIRQRVPMLHLADLAALGAPIGVFFGRIANFINGELLGRPASEGLAWAVKFPQEIYDWTRPSHPMHEKLFTPAFQRVEEMVTGLSGAAGEAGGSIYRRIVMATQESDAVAAALEPLLTPRHPSQIYAALLEGALVFLVLAWIWRRPRKPGVISGSFLLVYAFARIFGELFRTPDAHIGFQALGMTRGQWLSVVMVVIGVVGLSIVTRWPVKKIGGWGGEVQDPESKVQGPGEVQGRDQ